MLFVVAGILFFSQRISEEKLAAEKETLAEPFTPASLNSFVQHCLEQTAEDAVQYVSMRGGYYNVPEPAEDLILIKLPYYFDFGQKHFPTKELIEEQMELYVLDNLPECTSNFSAFKESGSEVTAGKMKIKVSLGHKALFKLEYPLTLHEGNSIIELKDFTYSLPLDFEKVYYLVNQTVAEHELNPNYVPIGEISASSHLNNFTFELSYQKNDVVVYSYLFDEYQLGQEDYVFVFASRYNWSELAPKYELDYVQEVEDQHCYVEDVCSYDLNIYDDPFTFEDFTELFDISPKGKIEFVPQQKDVGKHNVLVKISNYTAKEKQVSFTLEILSLYLTPEILKIEPQNASVNQTFTYQVKLKEPIKEITFEDDTKLFDVDGDGLINFTPQNNSLGFHIIEITADNHGLKDTEWMYLTVNEK
ncbi:hypothetical protein HZC30_05435 [Candidatus Woesearchaeota archaeon]|nr:hypothetical protein [Candidatus Woesearchaeota archaeon]